MNLMHLSEFDHLLRQQPSSQLRFALPDGTLVPAHFHVTEVGRVEKRFIDCGGTRRSVAACVLQVWVAEDRDHRLAAGKLSAILAMAADLLAGQDLPVEVEFERDQRAFAWLEAFGNGVAPGVSDPGLRRIDRRRGRQRRTHRRKRFSLFRRQAYSITLI